VKTTLRQKSSINNYPEVNNMTDQPILNHVQPGDPVTAQAWNSLVDAINDLYGKIQSLQVSLMGSVAVVVKDAATDSFISKAYAIASIAATNVPYKTGTFSPAANQYIIENLPPGSYIVRVTAADYLPASQTVEVQGGTSISVEVSLNKAVVTVSVPEVFGEKLGTAIQRMKEKGLNVSEVRDSYGKSIVFKPAIEAGCEEAIVVGQDPPAFEEKPGGTDIRLLVSAQVPVAPTPTPQGVQIPNLIGMTLGEAATELTRRGITLGKVTTKQ
jgi:hypothetical protein